MMKATTILNNLLKIFIPQPSILLEDVSCMLEDMLVFHDSGLFYHKFTVSDGLLSRVHKNQNLLVSLEVVQGHLIAFSVVNVLDFDLLGEIVVGIFRILNTHKVNQQRNRSIVRVEMEQPVVSVYFQKVTHIVIVG
jgi:hypothetical protein